MTGRKKKRFCPTSQFCTGRGQSLEGKDFGTMVGRKRGDWRSLPGYRKAGVLAIKESIRLAASNIFSSTGGRERMQTKLGIDLPRRCI